MNMEPQPALLARDANIFIDAQTVDRLAQIRDAARALAGLIYDTSGHGADVDAFFHDPLKIGRGDLSALVGLLGEHLALVVASIET
ncbi:hypothetical protein [Sphingomonas aquatica]|uniref:hypothetical protein n=1 Tax=Sphingomonas aquatica TaxID=1763824 RepID=UPI00301D7DB1